MTGPVRFSSMILFFALSVLLSFVIYTRTIPKFDARVYFFFSSLFVRLPLLCVCVCVVILKEKRIYKYLCVCIFFIDPFSSLPRSSNQNKG